MSSLTDAEVIQVQKELKDLVSLLEMQTKQIDELNKSHIAHGISSGGQLVRLLPPASAIPSMRQVFRHKAAIIVPYRDRPSMLATFVPALDSFLQAQGRDYSIFVLEQTPDLRFNRGMLLNAGVVLLAASDYDYFIFHDVDTVPTETGMLPYDYPFGGSLNFSPQNRRDRPLHLTPPGIHPKVRYEDFFGGVAAFTLQQLLTVNGYGNNYWGWGREDDNMRQRLNNSGMWPPNKPKVPRKTIRYYFRHSPHSKAQEVRMVTSASGSKSFFEADPDQPYEESLIVSSQPGQLDDYKTGLRDVQFWVKDISPIESTATRILIDLYCDRNSMPWCKP